MGWLARLWTRMMTWLEAGSRASARRRAPSIDDDGVPWEPDSVAVLPTEDSIDLHHFRPREVPSVVDAYLESAWEHGLEEVRIIHGRGKGVQRSVVARVLERHALVESFGPGVGAAGAGATVARLRRSKTKTSRGF